MRDVLKQEAVSHEDSDTEAPGLLPLSWKLMERAAMGSDHCNLILDQQGLVTLNSAGMQLLCRKTVQIVLY